MAEILLSLTIIGVVAAITLPSLTGNINERTWNTQRKALYARISQAVALMPALNGFGTLDDTTDTAAETFVTAGLAKVLKINNICDNEHIQDCGITSKFTDMKGSVKSMPHDMSTLNPEMVSVSYSKTTVWENGSYKQLNTKASAFETSNGESILLFYHPNCMSDMQETAYFFVQSKICVNMIYDLNGTKGPNTVGKDIGFLTVLYPTSSVVVAPIPYKELLTDVPRDEASTACTQQAGPDYRISTFDELGSLFANKNMIANDLPFLAIASSKRKAPNGKIVPWNMSAVGEYRHMMVAVPRNVFCVKR